MPLPLLVLLFLCWPAVVPAEVTFSVSWERPVQFRVVDAETGEPVQRPLVIVGTEKVYEGAPGPVTTFEVLRGGRDGRVGYQASEKVPGVELRVTAPGYGYLIKQVRWADLPPRERDRQGFDAGTPPVVEIALRNLERSGDWRREFRLSIGPALEELQEMPPPAMDREGKKLIDDFLDRERNRMLGI